MTKQELNLFKVAASLPANLRACPPKIMRRELAKVGCLGIAHHQPPYRLLISDLRPCKLVGFADRPEKPVFCNSGCVEPGFDSSLHAGRHRDRPNAVPFPAMSGSTQRPLRCSRSSKLMGSRQEMDNKAR